MRLHDLFWLHVKQLPTDFEPYGQRSRDEAEPWQDCSCGCLHFVPLHGDLGLDWGVCSNPSSPRVGLLTFEHQGCPQFESGPFEMPEPTPEQVELVRMLKSRWAEKTQGGAPAEG